MNKILLLCLAILLACLTGTTRAQWNYGNPEGNLAAFGVPPQLSAPSLYGRPQYQTDGGVGAIAAAIAEERELQAQRVQQQMQWAAEQIARQRNETIALKLMAAKNGMVIDNSNPFNPKVVSAAEYNIQQRQKEAVKYPIEIQRPDAKTRAKSPNTVAFGAFYERKSGDRKRELDRTTKQIGASGWREIGRKPFNGLWIIGVEFYRKS